MPEQWRSRIRWARYMGLNTIETYVPWNLHAPTPDTTTFDGMLDVTRFLETVAEEGLEAIVRPGPYVCAELDFGGLPAWLLRPPAVRIRSHDPAYLDHVARWLDVLLPRLVALQGSRGGPVRAMSSWVTDTPNVVTDRSVSLRFRFLVAMTGVLGIGGDLPAWPEEETHGGA